MKPKTPTADSTAHRIADLVANDARTLWFCRDMENPECEPETIRNRYTEWLEGEVRRILQEKAPTKPQP